MTSYQRNALLYASIVAMGSFIFGLDAALIAGTTDYLIAEFGLSAGELGLVVSAPAWGVLVALPFAGMICNYFGRKCAIMIVAILYVVSAVGSAFAPNYEVLVAARFLGGLAFSSISLASMYIGEIAPPAWRGKLVSMIQINIVTGLSGAYFLNYLIYDWANSGAGWVTSIGLDTYTWRWMLGSEIPFAMLWFLLLLFVPESPSWLYYRERLEDAKKALRKILPEQQIDTHIEEMQQSLSKSSQGRSIVVQLKALFAKPMRLIFIIALVLGIAQQTTGINAILFYAQTVFKQLGIGSDAAFTQAIWIGLTSMVFTALSLVLVDKFGRRPLILWGMIWIIISLSLCSFAFKQARYTISQETISEMADVPNVEKLAELVGVEYDNDIAFKTAVKEALGEEEAGNHLTALQQSSTQMNAM
ncbi:MAG: MFS transporter, partial [Verrucomicrobiota bacterium]